MEEEFDVEAELDRQLAALGSLSSFSTLGDLGDPDPNVLLTADPGAA